MEEIETSTYKTSFKIKDYQFIDGSVFLPEKFSIRLHNGEELALGYNECMTLCTLLEYPNTFVMRKVLTQNVWGDRGLLVDDNSLNQCISRLRKQINQTCIKQLVRIETLPRVGYKIVIDDTVCDVKKEILENKDKIENKQVNIINKTKSKITWVVLVSLVVHVLMICYEDNLIDMINNNEMISIVIKDKHISKDHG